MDAEIERDSSLPDTVAIYVSPGDDPRQEKPDLDAFIKSLSPEDLQKLKDTLNAG